MLRLVSHVHLRRTAAQQINECRVEGHDGVPHVDEVIVSPVVLRGVPVTDTPKQTLQCRFYRIVSG